MVGSLFFLYFCTAFELPLGKENKKLFILYSAHLIVPLREIRKHLWTKIKIFCGKTTTIER